MWLLTIVRYPWATPFGSAPLFGRHGKFAEFPRAPQRLDQLIKLLEQPPGNGRCVGRRKAALEVSLDRWLERWRTRGGDWISSQKLDHASHAKANIQCGRDC